MGYVESALRREDSAREAIDQNFRILITHGRGTGFWNDEWTGKLKAAAFLFPESLYVG